MATFDREGLAGISKLLLAYRAAIASLKLVGVPEGPTLWPAERTLFMRTDEEAKSRSSSGPTLLTIRGLLWHRSMIGDFVEMFRTGGWRMDDGSSVM